MKQKLLKDLYRIKKLSIDIPNLSGKLELRYKEDKNLSIAELDLAISQIVEFKTYKHFISINDSLYIAVLID